MEEQTSKKRKSYTSKFKLMVCERAAEVGNRTAARQHGVDERCVRRWREEKESLQKMSKFKRARRGGTVAWPILEDFLEKWIRDQIDEGRPVSAACIRLQAKMIAVEMGLNDFKGGPPWYYRFMKRKNLLGLLKRKGKSSVITTTDDETAPSLPEGQRLIIDSDPVLYGLFQEDDAIDLTVLKKNVSGNSVITTKDDPKAPSPPEKGIFIDSDPDPYCLFEDDDELDSDLSSD